MIDSATISNLSTIPKTSSMFPIRVTKETIGVFRQTDPLFCEFLIETGKIILENMPGQAARARE